MMTEEDILKVTISEIAKYRDRGLLEYIDIDDSYSVSLSTERDNDHEVNFTGSVDLSFKQWIPYEDYAWEEHTFTLFNIYCLNNLDSLSEALKHDLDRKVVEDKKEALKRKVDHLDYLSDDDREKVLSSDTFTLEFNTNNNTCKLISL